MMKTRLPLALLAASFAMMACDPCAGTSSCHTEERVSYTGHMVKFQSTKSVPGTAITFIRTGGVELASDTIRTTSGWDGFFTIESRALASGIVTGVLHIAPIGRPAFDIGGLQLQTTTKAGDGGTFGRIVVDPYLLHVIRLIDQYTNGPIADQVTVTFRRTGGIGADPEVISQTFGGGVFYLSPVPSEPGVISGELTVVIPSWGVTYKYPLSFGTHSFDAPPYEWDDIILPVH